MRKKFFLSIFALLIITSTIYAEPVVKTTPFNYAVQVDVDSNSDIYVGKAPIGAATSDSVWQIKFIDLTGSDVDIKWADGNSDFDNEWDERANLSYE